MYVITYINNTSTTLHMIYLLSILAQTSFKNGSRNKSANYRPVTLTSVICKLLERLIKDHMVDFLVRHKLLNQSQHGFLKARSCLTNMLFFWKKSLSG